MLESIFRHHAKIYPQMQPCDAVKLTYQATFGGAHLVSSEADVLEYLRAEHAAASPRYRKLYIESLGNVSRVYIDSKLDELNLQLLAKLFTASAALYPCGYSDAGADMQKGFIDRLSLLRELCRQEIFSFDEAALDAYLSEYAAAGYPAVSHSEAYRLAYRPAYRIIDSRYVRLIPLILEIMRRLLANERVVLALDGRCASGKTTAAKLISSLFDAETVHMDDFFLPPELRTPERLEEIGGNLHRERFLSEVIAHIRDDGGFSYRRFDCSCGDFAKAPNRVKPCKLLICEGAYALHPEFGKYYDIAAFSDISPSKQSKRILERDGQYMLSRFQNEWIPMEETYFKTFHIQNRADFILK